MITLEVMEEILRTSMEVMVMELGIGNGKQRASHLVAYESGPSR